MDKRAGRCRLPEYRASVESRGVYPSPTSTLVLSARSLSRGSATPAEKSLPTPGYACARARRPPPLSWCAAAMSRWLSFPANDATTASQPAPCNGSRYGTGCASATPRLSILRRCRESATAVAYRGAKQAAVALPEQAIRQVSPHPGRRWHGACRETGPSIFLSVIQRVVNASFQRFSVLLQQLSQPLPAAPGRWRCK